MAVLRSIAIFLVGAGMAIGAHFAGLFDRLPSGWNRSDGFAAGDRVPPGISYPDAPPGHAIDAIAAGERDADGPMPDRDEEGGYDGPPRDEAQAPVALHVAYLSSRDGGWDSGCAPQYELVNRTGALVLFSSSGENGDGPSRDVPIGPGASLSSDNGAGDADRYDDADYSSGPCRTGIVKIFLETP